jgi:hypothetical protein
LCTSNEFVVSKKFTVNSDGTFSEKIERSVRLECNRTGFWSYYDINHPESINQCKKRQCGDAVEIEISDFFTEHPGVFDDIITIDALLDNGYHVNITNSGSSSCDIYAEDEYTLGVYINSLGIVDSFYVWYDGDKYTLYYSKKYEALFCESAGGKYVLWSPFDMRTYLMDEIKAKIAKLYN